MLKSSASNSELTGMSGIVPDKWQRSHLLHHMACYSSHTICHWFLFFVFHPTPLLRQQKGSEYCQSHAVSQAHHTWGSSCQIWKPWTWAMCNSFFHSVPSYRNRWRAGNERSNFQFTFFAVFWQRLHADNRVWAKEGAEHRPSRANSRLEDSGKCEGRQALLLPQSFRHTHLKPETAAWGPRMSSPRYDGFDPE